jgi:hypothetical protein
MTIQDKTYYFIAPTMREMDQWIFHILVRSFSPLPSPILHHLPFFHIV